MIREIDLLPAAISIHALIDGIAARVLFTLPVVIQSTRFTAYLLTVGA